MGMDIGSAYHQILAGSQAAKAYGISAGGRREKPEAGRAANPFGKSASITLSRDGKAALERANRESGALSAVDRAKEAKPQSLAEANEAKLSDKAKAYLDKLREKHGDAAFDFVVGNDSDDTDALIADSSKAYSVILSNEDLERMADDEDYADRVMAGVAQAVEIGDRFAEEAEQQGVAVRKMAFGIGDDGSVSLFAELEKSSARRLEQMKAEREARREEEKEAAEKARKKEAEEALEEARASRRADSRTSEPEEEASEPSELKRTTIRGSSAEELLEQLNSIDWDSIAPVRQ